MPQSPPCRLSCGFPGQVLLRTGHPSCEYNFGYLKGFKPKLQLPVSLQVLTVLSSHPTTKGMVQRLDMKRRMCPNEATPPGNKVM